jgi:hypothetical protein
MDLSKSILEENFKKAMKPIGEKQLQDYRKGVGEKFKEVSAQKDSLINGFHNFKLQLISISGGTISVFVALQGSNAISLFTKFGFSFLGLSLLCGVTSIFLSLASEEEIINLQEKFDISGKKMMLGFIEKFGGVEVSTEREMQEYEENLVKSEEHRLKKRYGKLKQVLKLLCLDAQKIEDGQLMFFLFGIFLIVVGLFY